MQLLGSCSCLLGTERPPAVFPMPQGHASAHFGGGTPPRMRGGRWDPALLTAPLPPEPSPSVWEVGPPPGSGKVSPSRRLWKRGLEPPALPSGVGSLFPCHRVQPPLCCTHGATPRAGQGGRDAWGLFSSGVAKDWLGPDQGQVPTCPPPTQRAPHVRQKGGSGRGQPLHLLAAAPSSLAAMAWLLAVTWAASASSTCSSRACCLSTRAGASRLPGPGE